MEDGILLKLKGSEVFLFADTYKSNVAVEQVFDTEAHLLPVQGSAVARQGFRLGKLSYISSAEMTHRLSVSTWLRGCRSS